EAVAALADSSPLAAVYPDVAHRVSAGDGWRWRVVCACGEAGAPEALAWMGPHCGVCHDRREEGAPAPGVVWQGEVWRQRQRPGPVAFTPDGRRLLIWRRGYGRFLDLATGSADAILGAGVPGLSGVRFFPDGRTVAFADLGNPGTLRLVE